MALNRHVLAAALESIQFQPSNFFNALLDAVKKCGEHPTTNLSDTDFFGSKPAQNILKVIKDFTGLTFIYSVAGADYGPAVLPVHFSESCIFLTDHQREFGRWKDITDETFDQFGKEVLSGTIDLKNAKVTGDFQKVLTYLLLPSRLLKFNYLEEVKIIPEEVAAIILHEVGHAFNGLEYLDRTATTNQILAELAKAHAERESYETVVVRVGKKNSLSNEAIEALKKSKRPEEIAVILYGQAAEKSVSQLGASIFDVSACEQLADQFAVRCGAGRYIATGLAKIPLQVTPAGSQLVDNAFIAASLAGLTAVFPIGGLVAFVATFALALTAPAGSGFYGNFHTRLSRVRVELVRGLQQKKLSSRDRERFNADIRVIDSMIANENNTLDFIDLLAYYVRPGFRAAHKYERLQRELEDMSANGLFVKSSRLLELAAKKA